MAIGSSNLLERLSSVTMLDALTLYYGSIASAASVLGVPRSTLGALSSRSSLAFKTRLLVAYSNLPPKAREDLMELLEQLTYLTPLQHRTLKRHWQKGPRYKREALALLRKIQTLPKKQVAFEFLLYPRKYQPFKRRRNGRRKAVKKRAPKARRKARRGKTPRRKPATVRRPGRRRNRK